jgi:hypothetical protein
MDEQLIRYLLSIGINPYDPYQMNQMGGVLPLTDKDGMFNANTNTVQDIHQIGSDPAFIAQLGSEPGGFRPQDFDPQTSYMPVQAIGMMTLERYLNSQDPVSRLIAEVISRNGTANEAESEIRAIFGDPEDPRHEMIVPYVMTYMNEGEEAPDWKRIRDIATSLETAVISDPTFDGFDELGNPIMVREQESPASRYFREAGLPLPDERYGLEDFAGPERYDHIMNTQAGIEPARMEAEEARIERDALRKQMLGMVAPVMSSAMTDSLEAPAFGDPQDPQGRGLSNRMGRAQRNAGPPQLEPMGPQLQQGGLRGNQLGRAQRSSEPQQYSSRRGGEREGWMSPEQRIDLDRMQEFNSQMAATKSQIADAGRRMLDSQRDARNRQYGIQEHHGGKPNMVHLMMQKEMERSGRTPLTDTLAARRQAMLRYGIQT